MLKRLVIIANASTLRWCEFAAFYSGVFSPAAVVWGYDAQTVAVLTRMQQTAAISGIADGNPAPANAHPARSPSTEGVAGEKVRTYYNIGHCKCIL